MAHQSNDGVVKKIFTEDFEKQPFYDVPKWRIDTANIYLISGKP
tara:strand:- start:42 stop:173 length:132 start_codon:yes stop_codon:yes gene_type:complete